MSLPFNASPRDSKAGAPPKTADKPAGDKDGAHHEHGQHGAGAIDPVCGMSVDPHTTQHRAAHEGRTYYFCSAGCQAKFTAEPARYLALQGGRQPAARVPEGTIYTCPMHPEIRQPGPGNCPICGMALEPVLATAEAGPNPELVDMTRRFWIGLVLSVPLVALEMGGHVVNLHMLLGPSANWVQLAIATPVVLWAGWPFFVRGWQSIVTRNLNMFTLIAMGTGVAWVYSVVATLAPQIFPSTFRDAQGAVAVYFEAAAVITVLVLLGQVMELRAREQNVRCHSRAARPRAQDGAAAQGRRQRRGGLARSHRGRRSAAGAPGRESASRRCPGRGSLLTR